MAYIEVEGLKEFQKAVRAAKDRDLDKRLGQANKSIGQMVIDRLSPHPDPRAIGAGRGAMPRASASKREVILRVGGSHRAAGGPSREVMRMQPWGIKRVVRPGVPVPDRPFIQGTAEQNYDDIADAWMEATIAAFAPAFAESSTS